MIKQAKKRGGDLYSIRVVMVHMLMQLLPAGTAYTCDASRAVMLSIDSSSDPPADVKTSMLHGSVVPVILRQTPQLADMHRKVGIP